MSRCSGYSRIKPHGALFFPITYSNPTSAIPATATIGETGA
ncbi:MAG: hypothetical protein WC593_10065 [Methanoregula sp.]